MTACDDLLTSTAEVDGIWSKSGQTYITMLTYLYHKRTFIPHGTVSHGHLASAAADILYFTAAIQPC